MKLSTRGRYGARASLELALRYGTGPVMVQQIAKSQDISVRYLEHILNALRISKLVKSTRGAKGGYELAKNPARITLGEILRAIEGPVDIVHCTGDGNCRRIKQCIMNTIWGDVKKAIENVIDSITLEDIIHKHYRLQQEQSPEYII